MSKDNTLSLNDLSSTFSFPKGSRVLVVGDVMLDKTYHTETSRISPEAPVPVSRVYKETYSPGGAANVAVNLATLGVETTLIGVIGNDDNGETLSETLATSGIDFTPVIATDSTTITKVRVMAQNQQISRLDFEDTKSPAINIDEVSPHIQQAEVVVLSDYGKGALEDCSDIISCAKANGVPVIVDPKGIIFSKYEGAHIVTPNLKEFEAVVGPTTNISDATKKAHDLILALDLEFLLITLGARGMLLVNKEGVSTSLEATAKAVFDVTGAGDTVVALTAIGILSDQEMVVSVAVANIAAGLVVSKSGTASLSYSELENEITRKLQARQPKRLPVNSLLDEVSVARRNGEKVVFTNGCFDILHVGHIKYLENAKRLGDILVVAVNSDRSIKKLKGDDRPYNSLIDRVLLLTALSCVDYVVDFDDDTPLDLIIKIAPDILVKGADYSVDQIAGASEVIGAGGRVEVIDFVSGFSTTSLIEKIRSSM